jgi:hypothetical protein
MVGVVVVGVVKDVLEDGGDGWLCGEGCWGGVEEGKEGEDGEGLHI